MKRVEMNLWASSSLSFQFKCNGISPDSRFCRKKKRT